MREPNIDDGYMLKKVNENIFLKFDFDNDKYFLEPTSYGAEMFGKGEAISIRDFLNCSNLILVPARQAKFYLNEQSD